MPYEAELDSRNTIIVYDGNTTSLRDDGDAIHLAKILVENGSKYTVKILKGGYELFSRMYPFLRTHKIMYMPKVRLWYNYANMRVKF